MFLQLRARVDHRRRASSGVHISGCQLGVATASLHGVHVSAWAGGVPQLYSVCTAYSLSQCLTESCGERELYVGLTWPNKVSIDQWQWLCWFIFYNVQIVIWIVQCAPERGLWGTKHKARQILEGSRPLSSPINYPGFCLFCQENLRHVVNFFQI